MSVDLTGQKFGRLIVIKQTGKDKYGHRKWLCLCFCKDKVIVRGDSLKNGNTKSCGCFQKEIATKIMTKHGYSRKGKWSRTYKSWDSMKQRCINPNDKDYKNYGKRGITVCERWLKFENFLEDMGEAPEGFQIDRIKNKKGYCKSNCRWTTRKQQMRNTRRNHLITFQRKTQCIAAWAEQYNISYRVLFDRISELGWSTEKALTTPVRKKRCS